MFTRRGRNSHRGLSTALLGVGLVAAFALSACTSGTEGTASPPGGSSPTGQAAPKPAAKIAFAPAAGAHDISPVAPVRATVTDGTIKSIALTNAAGKKVKGTLSPDKRSWTVGEVLGYGKTYTWSGSAEGTDGQRQPISGAFSTVTPSSTIGTSINVGDGKTYGVAMPIAVTFDAPVTNKAAAEKAMTVQTSSKVQGAWAWLDDTRAHWRPRNYWPAGTQVTVNLKLYGLNYGGGVYGGNDLSSHFTIGRSQIVKANAKTHHVQIFRGGKLLQDFPASMGLDSDPGRVTNSGIHVVMEKHSTYSMCNKKYHYCDVDVPWAVRISNNGEFIHGYAGSIWAQGNTNVSHGCVNLSPSNAKIYFDEALTGDPVEVTGTTNQLDPSDGDYYDWAIPWSKWLGMSASA